MISNHRIKSTGRYLIIDSYLFDCCLAKELICKCINHNEACDIAEILSSKEEKKDVNRVSKLPKKNKVKRVQKKRPRKKN